MDAAGLDAAVGGWEGGLLRILPAEVMGRGSRGGWGAKSQGWDTDAHSTVRGYARAPRKASLACPAPLVCPHLAMAEGEGGASSGSTLLRANWAPPSLPSSLAPLPSIV